MSSSTIRSIGDVPIEMNAFSRRRNSKPPTFMPSKTTTTTAAAAKSSTNTPARMSPVMSTKHKPLNSSSKPHQVMSELWPDEEADSDVGHGHGRGHSAYDAGDDLHSDEETGLTGRERSRKRALRQSNMRLDHRITGNTGGGGDGDFRGRTLSLSEEEKREADHDVLRRLAINGVLILLWYLFSLSISLYNKWMFGQGNLNFAFPLFTTSLHMLVQFCLSAIVLWLVPSLRGPKGHNSDLGPVTMSRFFYVTRIGPCGAATGLDIGLGNMSLQFITLTFYTMCKSSSLAFVLMFAFIFRLEKPTWRLVAIIAIMTLGVVMMVAGEVEFSFLGFCLVILAAFFSGFRWGLTQILLLRNPATSNPFLSIFFLAPIMFTTLIIIAIPVEGFGALFNGIGELFREHGILAPLFLLFPGSIAFCMTAAEFALLQRTSVVTLSIAGIFKEVVTICAASLIFHDTLTRVNFLGLITTMIAIAAYNYIKITSLRQEVQHKVHQDHLAAERNMHLEDEAGTETDGGPDEDQFGLGSDDEEDAALLTEGHR
ncbi:hypothetical protein HOO65_080434 [Ceratocystis lukuohia]|uniref:Sugar phosphate transporter domain-containing protein n=2 Tax=Ceratocystis TaxID=5157 RepID=A0ABR4MB39_9PEZI|nr:putative transporter C22E12.01 [Ceratocystis platani]